MFFVGYILSENKKRTFSRQKPIAVKPQSVGLAIRMEV